jgi:two-component system, OmpR family, response regulator
MRLLVVEDDRDLNRQVSAALEAAGYAVDRAFDGEEGWFRGDTEPYDAVVLDIGLPKRDGISILEAWRKAGRTMPVLILTARDRWSDKVQGIDAGADDYVGKPFHMEEVLARLRALLRRAAGHASSDLTVGPVRLDARDQAHEPRIPPALLSHTSHRAHHLAQRDRRTSVRAGFRPRFEYDRSVYWAPAQETWRRHHQDRARPRLRGGRGRRELRSEVNKQGKCS